MSRRAETFEEIAAIIARYTKVDQIQTTAINGLFFNRRSAPTPPLYCAQSPCFALVAQGEKSLELGSKIFNYGVGDYLLVSLDLPVISRVTKASPKKPHLGLGLEINSERLNELLSRITIPQHATPTNEMRSVAVNKAPPDLLDATLRFLRLLDRPEHIAAMAPLIEQEILYHLLTGPCGRHLLQFAIADTASNKIAKAVAWLRANYAIQLRIEDLAKIVGMSESSLHHHFKNVTAMTPVQFQKKLRLHEARRLMLVENLDVGTVGYRVGYQSPSQFSREYSRLYGASPLRDTENLRMLINTP